MFEFTLSLPNNVGNRTIPESSPGLGFRYGKMTTAALIGLAPCFDHAAGCDSEVRYSLCGNDAPTSLSQWTVSNIPSFTNVVSVLGNLIVLRALIALLVLLVILLPNGAG